jgi:hypothetical protein
LCIHYNKGFGSKHKRSESNEIYDKSRFVLCNHQQYGHENNQRHFCQYVIFSHSESQVIKTLLGEVWDNLNPEVYESIGTPMFNKVVSKFMLENDYDWNKSLINIDMFAPYKWHQTNELFFTCAEKSKTLLNVKHSCCVHWFNGSPHSKKFINNFNHTNFTTTDKSNFMTLFNRYLSRQDKVFLRGISSD